jgi:hypothetical protein
MEASTDPDPGAAMATIHLHQTTTLKAIEARNYQPRQAQS